MFKFTCNPAMFRAALLAAGKLDVRYYLNGVLVERTARGVAVVSTDGNRMFVGEVTTTAQEGHAPVGKQWIISRDQIADIKASDVVAEFEMSDRVCEVTLNDKRRLAGRTIKAALIDGRFPDWRRVVPGPTAQDVPGQFNLQYLADARTAFKILGTEHVHIRHDGPRNSAVVSAGSVPAFIVVMPMTAYPAGDYVGLVERINERVEQQAAA